MVEDLDANLYGKPGQGGVGAGEDDDDEMTSNKYDRGFGKGKQ